MEIVATGSSSRMPVSVRLYDQGRVVLDRTVRVEVEVRRTIAVAGRVIERGASIGAGDIAPDTRWVPPGTGAVEPGTAAGSVAKRRMEPGEVVEAHLITPPTMIERGDEVVVRVVTGGFVVSRVAYALEDGVEGDRIELAAKTDPSLTLRAEVTGRGQALIRQGGAPAAGGTGIAISVDRR